VKSPRDLVPSAELVVNDDWERRVRALTAMEREDLLAAADPLQDGTDEEYLVALQCYTRLRDFLNPGHGLSAERINWAAGQVRLEDESWAPFVRRTALEAPGPEQRLHARVVLAQQADHHGRRDEAEHLYRAIVRDARVEGWDAESIACANLTRLYFLSGRLFEALVLARRNIETAKSRGDRWLQTLVELQLAMTHIGLKDHDRGEEYLEQAAEGIASLPEAKTRRLRLMNTGIRAQYHLARGEAPEALAALDEGDVLERGLPVASLDPRTSPLLRARALRISGRSEEAAALLERLLAVDRPDEQKYAEVAEQAVLTDLDRERYSAAAVRAETLLQRLEDTEPGSTGTGWRIDLLSRLSLLFAGDLERQALADRCRALAAQTVFERMVELESCVRDLPELGEPDPDVLELLREYRKSIARVHTGILETVAQSWEQRVREGEFPVEALATRSGLVRVCAWCERVKLPDREWLPLRTWLPDAFPANLTHGICEACSGRFSE
jgi:tetratricopeptide (TPR) repeat protein